MSKNLSSNQTKTISKKTFDKMVKDGRIEVQFDARPNLPKTSDTIWTFWSFDFKRSVQVAIPSKSGIFLEMYKKMQDYLGNGYVWERAICVDESKLQPIENFLESHLTSKDFDTNSIYINPNAKVQQ